MEGLGSWDLQEAKKTLPLYFFYSQIALRYGTSRDCFLPVLDLLEGKDLSLYPSVVTCA